MRLPRYSGRCPLTLILVILMPLALASVTGQRCDVRTGHIMSEDPMTAWNSSPATDPTTYPATDPATDPASAPATDPALPSPCPRGLYCSPGPDHARCRPCTRCQRRGRHLAAPEHCTALQDALCSDPWQLEALQACLQPSAESRLQDCGQFQVWTARDARQRARILNKVTVTLRRLHKQCQQSKQLRGRFLKTCRKWKTFKANKKATPRSPLSSPKPRKTTDGMERMKRSPSSENCPGEGCWGTTVPSGAGGDSSKDDLAASLASKSHVALVLSGVASVVVIIVAGVIIFFLCRRLRCQVQTDGKTKTPCPDAEYMSEHESVAYDATVPTTQRDPLESNSSDITSYLSVDDVGMYQNCLGERPAKPPPPLLARSDSSLSSLYTSPYRQPLHSLRISSSGHRYIGGLPSDEELHHSENPLRQSCLSFSMFEHDPASLLTRPPEPPIKSGCEDGGRQHRRCRSARVGRSQARGDGQHKGRAAYCPSTHERVKQPWKHSATPKVYASFQESADTARRPDGYDVLTGTTAGMHGSGTLQSVEWLDYSDACTPSSGSSRPDGASFSDGYELSCQSLTNASSETQEDLAFCAGGAVFIRNAIEEENTQAPLKLNCLNKSYYKNIIPSVPFDRNLCSNDTASSGTQTSLPADSSKDFLGQPWQDSFLVSPAGGRLSRPGSEVLLEVPGGCVPVPTIFHVAVHTSTEELTQRLLCDHPDLTFLSPVAECRTSVPGMVFDEAVCISLPFRSHAPVSHPYFKVLCFEVEATGRVRMTQVDTRAKDNRVVQPIFYEVSGPDKVAIFTRHFTLFACATCKRDLDVDLLAFAFTRHSKESNSDHWSKARVRILIADKKFEIPDFEQRLIGDQAKEGFQFWSKKALNLHPQCRQDSFLLLKLVDQIKGHDASLAWEHLSSQSQPLFPQHQRLPVEEVVHHCLRKEPKMVEWAMARRGAGNSCLACAVEIDHGCGGLEVDTEGRSLSRSQGHTVLLLDDIPVTVLSLERPKRDWLSDAPASMSDRPQPRDWKSEDCQRIQSRSLPFPGQQMPPPVLAPGQGLLPSSRHFQGNLTPTTPLPLLTGPAMFHSVDGSHTQPKRRDYFCPVSYANTQRAEDGAHQDHLVARGDLGSPYRAMVVHGVEVSPQSLEDQEDMTFPKVPSPCLGPNHFWNAQAGSTHAQAQSSYVPVPQELFSSECQRPQAYPALRHGTVGGATGTADLPPRAQPAPFRTVSTQSSPGLYAGLDGRGEPNMLPIRGAVLGTDSLAFIPPPDQLQQHLVQQDFATSPVRPRVGLAGERLLTKTDFDVFSAGGQMPHNTPPPLPPPRVPLQHRFCSPQSLTEQQSVQDTERHESVRAEKDDKP